MADSAGSGTPQWKSYSTSGPAVAHHASCVLRNKLFVHGGVERHGGAQPGSGLWCLDLDAATWSAVSAAGSPALSHHAAVGRDNRYLVLVGAFQRLSQKPCDLKCQCSQRKTTLIEGAENLDLRCGQFLT